MNETTIEIQIETSSETITTTELRSNVLSSQGRRAERDELAGRVEVEAEPEPEPEPDMEHEMIVEEEQNKFEGRDDLVSKGLERMNMLAR
jgi:hypothetical protein